MAWWAWTLVAYLGLGLLWKLGIQWIRRRAPRAGPFGTPDGQRFWVVWDDPLADLLMKGHANAVTVGPDIGLSTTATTGLWKDWSIVHEHEHVGQQCAPLGSQAPRTALWMLGVVTGPVCVLLSVLGPFEKGPKAAGLAMLSRPQDTTRQPWSDLATKVNQTRPV